MSTQQPRPRPDGRTLAQRGLAARRQRAHRRRREACGLYAQGLLVADIARRLQVSRQTVYTYLAQEDASPSRD